MLCRTVVPLSFLVHCCWCVSVCSSHQETCDTQGSWIEDVEHDNEGLQMLQVRGQHIHAGEHAAEHASNVSEVANVDTSLSALFEKYDRDQGSLLLSSEADHIYAQVIRKQWRRGGNCSASDDGMGSTATLDQTGYTVTASLCCNFQMEFFIRRIISSMGLKLCQEGGLMRFIPSFSCASSLTLAELKTRIALARLYPGKAKYPFVEVVSKSCPTPPQADGTKQVEQAHKPTPLKMWDAAKREMADSLRKEDKMVYASRAASSLLPIAEPVNVRHAYKPAASIQGAATVVRHHGNGLKETLLPQFAECWDAGSDQSSRDAACEGDLKCSRKGFDNRYFGDCDWAHCCSKEVKKVRYAECWDAGEDVESRDAACEGNLKCARSGFDGRDFGDCEEDHCCSEVQAPEPEPHELKPWDEEEKKALDRYEECYDHGADRESRDAACKGDLKCARHGFDSRLFGDCEYVHCCSEEALADHKAATEGIEKDADVALQGVLEAHKSEARLQESEGVLSSIRQEHAHFLEEVDSLRPLDEHRTATRSAGDALQEALEAHKLEAKLTDEESQPKELLPWAETKAEELLDRYAECWDHGEDTNSRDAACKGDLKCARHGFDDRLFGDCEAAHCCSEETSARIEDAQLPDQKGHDHGPEEKPVAAYEEKQSGQKKLLQRYDTCWEAGDDTESRDAACEGDLKCARYGFDNRNFGECDDDHCCSKEVLDRYEKCWDRGTDQESRDAACQGDLKCARRGFDGRIYGDCNEEEGYHCCSVEMSSADLKVADAQAAVTRIMKRLGSLRELRTSLNRNA